MRLSASNLLTTTLAWLILASPALAENRLAGASSPHLKDHADNPVEWYPWGEEAFERAREEKKPLFVSIGYHSCHWCHKMMRESFQDPATARLLNEHFVNVKVDREMHPDIDRIYMAYMQASQGNGGWPLNVWLTPDLVPFSVGTYFPKDSSAQQPAFEKVLSHIVNQWERFPDYIDSQSRRDLSNLSRNIQDLPSADLGTKLETDAHLLAAYERLSTEFDPQHGGFGQAPRFPNPSKISTAVLFMSKVDPGSFRASQTLKMITKSLDGMANGGIHDQIGGGFHRYTSDPGWASPHFEKMLTDQALLLDTYLDGFELTGNQRYLDVATGIASFVESTLAAPEGAYYSAQHSDSLPSADAKQIEEGAYYQWTAEEFAAATGQDAELLAFYYEVRQGGNSPLEVGGALDRKANILRVKKTPAEVAARFNLSLAETTAAITRGREALLEARRKRPAPKINEQIVTSSNALMVSALAHAYMTTGDEGYLSRATRTLRFIREKCYEPASGTLFRIFNPDGNHLEGVADDYAFTIQACLDLHHASLEEGWIMFADELQGIQNKLFFDKHNGGFYNTPRTRSDIILRLKSYEDGAEMSPNASSILNLARMGYLLGDERYLNDARRSLDCFRGAIERVPTLASRLLLADLLLAEPPAQIVIVGERGKPDTDELLAVAREEANPAQILLLLEPGTRGSALAKRNEQLGTFQAIDGKATAHLCRDFACKAPTTNPAELRAQITGK